MINQAQVHFESLAFWRLLHSSLVLRKIPNTEVVTKLFDDVGPRYVDRPGGYTRIVKLGPRRGDGAEMAKIELI